MRPLRFVALSADGQAMILTDEVGRMLSLAIDDQVIAAVQRERTGTPGQLSMDVEATLTPRDIQSRIRSGESAEHVARLANVPMEKVLRFAGPVLQERAAMAQLARRTRLRGADSGQTLADVVDARLRAHGVDVETVAWDSHRRDDGGWRTTATWPSGKATAHAIWDLDRARSMATPVDEMANFLSSEKQELLIGPDEQGVMFGVRSGQFADDADPKEGPVVPTLSMLRRRDDRRRDEEPVAPAREVAREIPRELPREAIGRESRDRGRAIDPRFDDFRRGESRRDEPTGEPLRPTPARLDPSARLDHPAPSRLDPAAARLDPTGSAGVPAAGHPISPGLPAAGLPGPAREDRRGASWLDEPRRDSARRESDPLRRETDPLRRETDPLRRETDPARRDGTDVRRPDPWGDDPRRPAGRRGDPLPAAGPPSGRSTPGGGEQPPASGGGLAGRSDWRERLDPTGVGTPPAPTSPPPTPPSKNSRGRKAELPSWDDILFGSGSRRGS